MSRCGYPDPPRGFVVVCHFRLVRFPDEPSRSLEWFGRKADAEAEVANILTQGREGNEGGAQFVNIRKPKVVFTGHLSERDLDALATEMHCRYSSASYGIKEEDIPAEFEPWEAQ